VNVLGLCSGTHDSAAALICDGELVGLVEEERLNGEKHTKTYPERSVRWLLKTAGITADDLDEVAYNFVGPYYLRAVPRSARYLLHPATARRALPRARSFALVQRNTRRRVRDLQRRFPGAQVRQVAHHRAHGLYAFAASGYSRAAVLVVDSLGETATTTIARMRRTGTGVEAEPILTIHDPVSLGYAYGAVTEHLGWRRGDEEGTVMALAALGDPARFRDVLARAVPLTADGFALDPSLLPLRVISSRYPRVSGAFIAATCPPRTGAVEQVHADLAAALQERVEEVMLHLARKARRTGCRRLCVGGGVAMNCVAIGHLVEQAGFDEVFVPPAPGDSGTAAGAALAIGLDRGNGLASGVMDSYLGPSHRGLWLDPDPRPELVARRVSGAARFLAHRLALGSILGVFQGPLEAGPRALGNRSILASPLDDQVVRRLNEEIKFREPFRPFAPAVLAERAADYFTLGQPSPYMAIASGVTDLARKVIPSVVHVNGTARVQTVSREGNPFLADVLAVFEEITGVPVLINTSLNIKGKPICGTPDMALDCLTESGLDRLLRSKMSKEAEILVRRHQLAVLRRQVARPTSTHIARTGP
jgi:carbamoyltransferase